MPAKRYVVYPQGGGAPYVPPAIYNPATDVTRLRSQSRIMRHGRRVKMAQHDLILQASGATAPTGQTLLQYFANGGASSYVISGQTLSIYSGTPLDAISNYKPGVASGSYSGLTVSSNVSGHAFDSGVLPGLINPFVVAGPQVTGETNTGMSGGAGWYINMAPGCPLFSGNAAPHDWESLTKNALLAGCIVDLTLLLANPAGPGNNPWTYGGGILNAGSATYNTFIGYLAALVPALLRIQAVGPIMLSPPGELNLSVASPGTYSGSGPVNGFTNIGNASTDQVSALFALIFNYLVSQGFTRFTYNFETNLGVGNYNFGFNAAVFDTVSVDSEPMFYDSTCDTFLRSTGLPMWYGSSTVASSGNGIASYTVGQYSGTGSPAGFGYSSMLTQWPKFFAFGNWCQSSSFWTQNEASQCVGVATPHGAIINQTSVPSFLSARAGGKAGG